MDDQHNLTLETYPRISAYRSDAVEAWRLARLRHLLSLAGKSAVTDIRRTQLRRGIARIRDHKGDLHILWDGEFFEPEFAELVRDAWRSLGQFTPISNTIEYR